MFEHVRFGRSPWLAGLMVILCQATAATAAGPASRDAVWRSIFAPPPAAPVSGADEQRVRLGADLFRDVRLSGSGAASCATCHDPAHAFVDGRRTAVGPAGASLAHNTPALYDLAGATAFFWDGRAASLEEQARGPILSPHELGGTFEIIAGRLSADPAMGARFAEAFPPSGRVTEAAIVEALAAYVRSLTSPTNRFDAWIAGDDSALGARERAGFDIFVGKGGCVACHGGWRLTDGSLHDIGLPATGEEKAGASAPGRFKTPSLREAVHTAPYMHDGSLATLEDVVDHYAGGLMRRPSLSPALVPDLALSDAEKAALVSFLRTLSSE